MLNIIFVVPPPPRTKSKTSPKNDHPRIAQNDFPNSRTIFCAIHLLQMILLHLTEIPEYLFLRLCRKYSKHPPKTTIQELRKMSFQGFQLFLYFTKGNSKPQHNDRKHLKIKIHHQSIKVRFAKWRKRTLKNE